jgi:hypothetical protein
MNRKQLENPFIPDQIKHRKGNFNRTLAYIEAPAIITRLNDAFDAAWSFEILEHHILQEEVLVLGKLTAEGIVKTQFGSSQITRKKDTAEIISLGDDLKVAATDALKKAATLLGVGLQLYSEETRQPPMNNQGYDGTPGYSDHPGYPPGNSHHHPMNGSHDHGHPQGAQYQPHTPVNGQQQNHPRNNRQAPPANYPADQTIQTPKRLSSKQYQYLKQLASDRSISSQELAQLTSNKFGCTLDFLSSRQASELITELQQDKTAA